MKKIGDIFKKISVFELVFLVSSFLIFTTLMSKQQKLYFDAYHYYNLGLGLFENNYDILNFNFSYTTFIFPLYLSFLIGISEFINVNSIYLINFFSYLIFVFSTFFIYKALIKTEKNIGRIFLLLSGFNIINLSFTNVVLTESLVVLFVSALFYLLSKKGELSKYTLFLIGLTSSLNVLARPLNLLLFICVLVYVIFLLRGKLLNIVYFLLPVIILFSIQTINIHNAESKIQLFSSATNGIYDMQVKVGKKTLKYETSIDERYKNDSVFYENNLSDTDNSGCIKAVECLYEYLKSDSIEYLLILAVHSFNLLDRNYINTYIENLGQVDYEIMLYNYFIISSVICYLLFVIDFSKFKKHQKIFSTALLLIVGTLTIYIPTVVESRFSSPVFPLFILVASFYLFGLHKSNIKYRIILIQALIIFLLLMISYLVRQNIVLNPI